jgi:hypothetical protein
MKTALSFILSFFIVHTSAWALESSSEWYSKNPNNKVILRAELFLSSTCDHCKKADAFFKGIENQHPEWQLKRYWIDQDKKALLRFNQLLTEQQMNDFSVPSLFFCNSRWSGFISAETTGKDLVQALNYCTEQIEKKGRLTSTTVDTLRHLANANRFTTGLVKQPSSPRDYTLTLALIDSFNPCALFGFMGFLAFLLVEEQRKKQIIGSLLFIFSIGIIHYVQQVYTSTFFSLIPWIRIPALVLGLMIFYFVIQKLKNRAATVLYYVLSFLVGLITLIYQQTCVMNWSIIFEQWLNNQHMPSWESSLYQVLYQSVYIVPLILFLLVYLLLSSFKYFDPLRKKLIRIGLLFMLAIALALVIYPFIMHYLGISVFLLFILSIIGYFLNWT